MRFIGIDIGAESHVVAVVDEAGGVLVKSTPFSEDAEGYAKLRALLGSPEETLCAMEATGHYWQNLFAFLAAEGFQVALLNPLRTHRFAGEDLRRAKTDAIDAVGIARFAQQKRPVVTPLPDEATLELRELVRLRDRMVQDMGDRVRQLHRTLDLTFPEFPRLVRDLTSFKATGLLLAFPTGTAFRDTSVEAVAELKYDGRHRIGEDLAASWQDARWDAMMGPRIVCRPAMPAKTSPRSANASRGSTATSSAASTSTASVSCSPPSTASAPTPQPA